MTDRDEMVKKAQEQLDHWNTQIEALQTRMKAEGEKLDEERRNQLETLRAQRDRAEARIKELTHTTDEAWRDVKVGLDRAWDDLSKSLETARMRFY